MSPLSPERAGPCSAPDPADPYAEYVSPVLGRFPRAPHVIHAPSSCAPLLFALLYPPTPTPPQKGENKTPMIGLNPTHLHGHAYWFAVVALEMGRHALPGAEWSVRGLHVAHPPKEGRAPEEACHALGYSCTSGLVVDVCVPIPAEAEGVFHSRTIALSEVASWAGGEINRLGYEIGELLADLRKQRPDVALLAAQNYLRRKA